jgi:hypothetical protein
MNEDTRHWLLEAPEPYILYQARKLLAPKEADPALLDGDPFIRDNIRILTGWKETVLERHDKPDLFIHRLSMLSDLGVTIETEGMLPIVNTMLDNIAPDGSFRINISIPKAFGGTGEPSREWLICDFPVVVHALLRMGVRDERLEKASDKLASLTGKDYVPCSGSIPKFKGPGPRGGMCPYANLLVARALAAHPVLRTSSAANTAAGAILDHWTERKTKKPFLFAMGTDFKKLKFPLVWYNLLHVLSALSGIPAVEKDPRLQEMMDILFQKSDGLGRYTPESIYMCYKTEEWSDKKKPSRLLTVMASRLVKEAL